MTTHVIKINQNYADAVLHGEKNFEIRYNDRGYQKGDRVFFIVVDDSGSAIAHRLSHEAFRITYLIHGYGLKEGWCVFGIKKWEDSDGLN